MENLSIEQVCAIANEHGAEFPGMTAGQVRDAIEAIRTQFNQSPFRVLCKKGESFGQRDELFALVNVITGSDPNLWAKAGECPPGSWNTTFLAKAPQYPDNGEIAAA